MGNTTKHHRMGNPPHDSPCTKTCAFRKGGSRSKTYCPTHQTFCQRPGCDYHVPLNLWQDHRKKCDWFHPNNKHKAAEVAAEEQKKKQDEQKAKEKAAKDSKVAKDKEAKDAAAKRAAKGKHK